MIASATVDATSSTDYEDEGEAELENKKSSIKSDDGVRNNNNEQGSQCASDIESADELDDCLESSSTTPARELPETEATSHPSLTPTPPTPVETLDQDDTESESQEKSDGPSVVATIDFNPEAEYFSDPDLHDERPPKPCSSKDCQQDRSDDRRLISRQSEESEITAVQLELTSESENPIASRALCSSYSDLSSVQPITASDARAESFVDESTLADELASLRSEIRKISTASSSDETIASTNNTLTLDTKEVDQPEESAFVERSDNIVATHFEHEQVQPNNPEVNSQSNDDHLLKTLREYCDRLADLIREEAIKQLEEASYLLASSSSGQNSTLKHRISFLQVLEVEQVPSATMEAQNKKIYTSSMYYNDQLDSFPTIEQQVERSRTIAKQLEDVRDDEDPAQRRLVEDLALDKQDVNIALQDKRRRDSDTCSGRERASVMFKQRRERMNKYTLVSGRSLDGSNRSEARDVFRRGASVQPESYKNCASNSASSRRRQSDVLASSIVNFSLAGLDDRATLTDTEYEAPKVRRRSLPARATTTPFRERSNRHVEMDASQSQREKFRPFLDPSTLKDIERLKSWSPHVDFNEHNSVSPEVCLKLVRDLEGKKEPSRGACLFGQRQLNSADWIVESSKYDDERDETKAGRAQSAIKSTCIAATEGETSPLAELQAAPVMQISHQAQPQLETATVTSMPSFSTSSRRVIECDSPDLLTSRDDEDIDVDADAGEDGVALATANAAELAQELEPRVRSSVGRMHQSSLLDWRRPRVETPIWQVSDSGALPLGKRQQAAERQRAARSSSVAPELCSSERGFVRAGSAPRANHWQPAISGKFAAATTSLARVE